MFVNRASSFYSITGQVGKDEYDVGNESLTGSESKVGGVEAAVLDGVGRVITNEGPGLGETEETVIVVCEDALWSRVARTRSRFGRP